MTGSAEPESSFEPEVPAPSAGRTHTRRLRWWVAAITFVGGVVVGVLAVGLLSAGTPVFGSGGPGGGAAPTSSRAPGPDGVPVVAQAQVNAACLSVINEAQDTYTVLTDVSEAAADVDLQQLDDIVRRLQPIEARLSQDLPDCEVDTSVQAGPSSGGSPQATTPEPSPTR
jgi:hypothetical protein